MAATMPSTESPTNSCHGLSWTTEPRLSSREVEDPITELTDYEIV